MLQHSILPLLHLLSDLPNPLIHLFDLLPQLRNLLERLMKRVGIQVQERLGLHRRDHLEQRIVDRDLLLRFHPQLRAAEWAFDFAAGPAAGRAKSHLNRGLADVVAAAQDEWLVIGGVIRGIANRAR